MDPERQLERAFGIGYISTKSRAAYMKRYRDNHPDYVERSNAQKRERYRREKEARDVSISEDHNLS